MMEGTIYIGCYVYEYDEGASQRIQRQTSRTPIENLSYQQKLAQAGVGGYPGVCYNKKEGSGRKDITRHRGGRDTSGKCCTPGICCIEGHEKFR